MDRTRTRRASLRRRPSEAPKPTFEELKPEFHWDQLDDTHHRLHIYFPGFVRREINVEADNARKLIRITGSSTRRDTTTTTTTKIITVDQTYLVPKDGILEEMSMEFQDGLYLTIMIPIRRGKKKKTTTTTGDTGDQKQQRSHDHGQKDDVEGGHFPKKPAESSTVVEKKDEPTPIAETPKCSNDKLDKEADMVEKPKIAGEGSGHDEDATIQREKKSEHTTDEETSKISSAINVMKRARELEEGRNAGGSRKRKAIWTGPLEKKRSTTMMIVAVVAFSLGFYVSHMLRSGESNQAYII